MTRDQSMLDYTMIRIEALENRIEELEVSSLFYALQLFTCGMLDNEDKNFAQCKIYADKHAAYKDNAKKHARRMYDESIVKN